MKLLNLQYGLLLWQALFLIVQAIRIPPKDFYGIEPSMTNAENGDLHRRKLMQLPSDNAFNSTDSSSRASRMLDNGKRKSVTVNVPTNPDDHLVTSLPFLDAADFSTRHWAGLLPASADSDKYFFYWLFAPAIDAHTQAPLDDAPLLVWLNGGPACSSMDGLWLENGPFRLVEDQEKATWSIKPDPFSWHTLPAYTLYIDQPVGTGLSFTSSSKYPSNDNEVNIDFYYFMEQFMTLHSDKFLDAGAPQTLNREFFFSGESHAGHYIPSMINHIRKRNAQVKEAGSGILMPLTGAAIGNGWVHPKYQYSAHEAGYGVGIVGRAQRNSLDRMEKICQDKLAAGEYNNNDCRNLLDAVIDNSQGAESSYVVSSYDNRKWERAHHSRDFPLGHKVLESYLGGHKLPTSHKAAIPSNLHKEVLAAVHASPSRESGQVYYECTDPPYEALKHQDGLGVTSDVVDLLQDTTQETKIRLLFFNGIHDLICNHVGNEIWMEKLEWSHQNEFIGAKRYGWQSTSTNTLAGYYKEFENFGFLKVLDSGHMVPLDIPDVAKEMMQIFMKNTGGFSKFGQRIARERDTAPGECPICTTLPTEALPSDQGGAIASGDGKGDNDETKDCAKCPICSDSPSSEAVESQHKADSADSAVDVKRPGLEFGDFVLPQAIVLLIVLASLLSCCITLMCCRSGSGPKASTGFGSDSLNGDLELPGAGYRDEMEDEYGEVS